jgi:hypothetical protein
MSRDSAGGEPALRREAPSLRACLGKPGTLKGFKSLSRFC